MKINELLEKQELLPRTPHRKAEDLGKEFVKLAIKQFGKGDSTYNPEVHAKKIAANFHKAMVAAIDDDLKYRKMKKVGEPDRADRSEKRYYGAA